MTLAEIDRFHPGAATMAFIDSERMSRPDTVDVEKAKSCREIE